MADNIAINIVRVSKSFKLPHEKQSSIKGAIIHFGRTKKGFEEQHVLNNVSFEIKKGEFFGIVGRNGSGKSTLLKLLAGIYTPDKGTITVNGKLTPFIELGVGFNPELSGRENVFLNGALLGFNRKEMDAMYDEIVEFAELERFMDQKLKNYSSGMQVRLAFSIAIRANTDILLLDEVLAVGDSAFQNKCFDYFSNLKREKKTVVLVTHSMAAVEKYCNRALLLEKGDVIAIGNANETAARYEELFINDQNRNQKEIKSKDSPITWPLKVAAKIISDGNSVNAIKVHEKFTISFDIISNKNYKDANIGINIRNDLDHIVFSADSRKNIGAMGLEKNKKRKLNFTVDNCYTNGKYTVDIHIINEIGGPNRVLYKQKGIIDFTSHGVTDHVHSLFQPRYDVEVE